MRRANDWHAEGTWPSYRKAPHVGYAGDESQETFQAPVGIVRTLASLGTMKVIDRHATGPVRGCRGGGHPKGKHGSLPEARATGA